MAGIQKTVLKGIRYLKKRGIRKTVRKTALHLDRKASERRYVKRMIPTPEEQAAQRGAAFQKRIRFSVIVPLYNTPPALLRETIGSVQAQTYENWELCLADGSDGSHGEVGEVCGQIARTDPRIRYRKLEKNEGISGNSNAALTMAGGDYIALFDHDDLLTPDALYEMARAIEETDADFLYSDEMIFASPKVTKVIGIRFKPDFSPDDLLTNNFICHLTVFRRTLLERAGAFRSEYDGSQDHDLILRLTAEAKRIVHVPKVLYCWRSIPGSVAADIHMKEYAIGAGRRAVEDFLRARGQQEAAVESTAAFPTMYRIRWPIAGEPSVRILADLTGTAGDPEERLAALKKRTSWRNCVWTAVGGGGAAERKDASRRQLLAEAAAGAAEDYLLFTDGNLEPLNPDWIQEMLMLAQREKTGAVGAKVRFAGGEDLRHAGVILGMGQEGIAGRPYFDMEDDGVGFFGQLAVVRTVSAVTDCWMVKREKFAAAGGFDPDYRGALFDIDFCLKLGRMGARNLWTPDAGLQGGRVQDFCPDAGKEYAGYPEDSAVFRRKWRAELEKGDPYFNRNLSLKHEDWRIG